MPRRKKYVASKLTTTKEQRAVLVRSLNALYDAQSYMETSDDDDVLKRAEEVGTAATRLNALLFPEER